MYEYREQITKHYGRKVGNERKNYIVTTQYKRLIGSKEEIDWKIDPDFVPIEVPLIEDTIESLRVELDEQKVRNDILESRLNVLEKI